MPVAGRAAKSAAVCFADAPTRWVFSECVADTPTRWIAPAGGEELDAFITYDVHLADAARAAGLTVVVPA
jgi:hypothetical protein